MRWSEESDQAGSEPEVRRRHDTWRSVAWATVLSLPGAAPGVRSGQLLESEANTEMVEQTVEEIVRALLGRREAVEALEAAGETIAQAIPEEALTGPERERRVGELLDAARQCRAAGVLPYHLTRAAARLWLHEDASGGEGEPREAELRAALDLAGEPEIAALLARQIRSNRSGRTDTAARIEKLRTAYEHGFRLEQEWHGCGQCVLAALFEATGEPDPQLYQAASAFSGGIGLCGDGACGGYAGGSLFMSSKIGRRLEQGAGDRERRSTSYRMTQALRERFLQTYGSIVCHDIHESLFGRSFKLSDPNEREAFHEAGAHRDKCTSLVGMAAFWTIDILIDQEPAEA